MLEKAKRKVKKAVSMALAAVMCTGMIPATAADVSAANYSVHTVNDLTATANEQESSDALLIVNTRNYSVTVNNKDFVMMKTLEEKTRTNIVLSRDKIPVKEDETKTWQNVCQIKYEKVGYLPDGRWVDLTYTLDKLTLTGTVRYDYNSEGSYMQVCAATVNGAQSGVGWYNASDESLDARTPYAADHQWSVKVTASDGGSIGSIKMPLLFKDIDIVSTNNSGDVQTEGITLISGFASDTWVQNGSKLKVTDGGAKYDATAGGSETDDPANMFLVLANSTSLKLGWRGQSCRTYITPISATGTYATIDKSVNKSEANLGDRITYTIPVTFGPTNEVNQKKSALVYDDLNEILDITGAEMRVEKGGNDVTSEWKVSKDGQRVTFTAKDPVEAQGDYKFYISANITKDTKLVDRLIKEGKVTLKESDIEFENKAFLKFDDASDHSVEVETEVPVPVIVPSAAKIMLEKSTTAKEIKNGKAGDVIPYTFRITNNGEKTLYNVNIKDDLAVSDFTYDWSTCASGKDEMLPGETATATANYILTQEDIDAGKVINTATVYGTDILGETVQDSDDAETTVTGDPAIQIIKTVDKTQLKNVPAGETLNYTFEVKNTGGVTLNNLAFADDREIGEVHWDKAFDSLAPGQVIKGSAAMHITQDDIDAGKVINKASITGTAPDGREVSDEDDVETVILSDPAIHLVKTSNPLILTAEESVAGHAVPFTFTVTNSGYNTLHDIRIVDELEGVSDVVIDWNTSSMGSKGSLLPGEEVEASASYELTQKDVDKEKVINTATVYGTDPTGKEVSCPDDVTIKLAGADNAKIQLDKEIEFDKIESGKKTPTVSNSADLLMPVDESTVGAPADILTAEEALQNVADADSVSDEGNEVLVGADGTVIENAVAGMTVPFRFKITNTGHKTLYNVFITDEMEGLSKISYDWSTVASKTDTMLPGEAAYATAEYKLTQADIDAGRIDNYAFVIGTPEIGDPVTDDGEAGTPIKQNPEIKIVKDTTAKVVDHAAAGETKIPYTFMITNTGNNTLSDITFKDDHDLSGLTWEKELSSLAPGESVRGSADYTITQEDIANGSVLNTAIVNATDPQGTPVRDEDDTESKIEQYASLTLTKTVDQKKIENAKVGDLITYEISCTNDGNLTVKDIVFKDSLSGKGLSELEYVWPGTAGILLPGETVLVKATYTVAQKDIDAGTVANSVSVTGIPDKPNDPDPEPITPPEPEVETELEQKPDLQVTKAADRTEIRDAKPGDEIVYTIIGENTGNVTLENVKITDKLEDIKDMKLSWDKAEGTLQPGEKVTAKAVYSITVDDIAAGTVKNVVILTGDDPKGDPHEDEDDAESLIPSVSTEASDAADGDKKVIAATTSVISDKISFKDFETRNLTVVSTLYDKAKGEILKVNGSEVFVTKNVALKENNGSTEIQISFNGTGLGGKTLCIVTKVYEAGTDKLICQHNTDLSDEKEAVAMLADSTTTITGEKKTTQTPKQGTVTQRSTGSSNPSGSTNAPSTKTAASVKTGDDNVAREALLVLVVAIGFMAGCGYYFRRKKASK